MALSDLIRGRQVVAYMTNKSGGSVAAGDVVILDSANDESFTTTTSASSTAQIGVALESIANNAQGRVATAGYVPLVNVSASVTRGHYAFTHTVAKQAAGNATHGAGAFAVFLKSSATPSALLFGATAQSGGGGGGGQFDDATLPMYRLPASWDYTQIAQPDPGDSSNSFLQLDGNAAIVSTPDGVNYAQVSAFSNGNVSMSAGANGSVILTPAGTGRVSMSGKGAVFPSLAADPSSPVAGQTYFNTGSGKLRCYTGSGWVDVF